MLSTLETARSVYTSTVGRVAEVGMTSVGEFVGCGEGGGIDEDDTAEGSCAIAYGFGTLDDLDLTCTRVVYFGSVVGTPALALEADTIADEEDTATMHPLDHGLGDRRTALDGADTRQGFQQTRDGLLTLRLQVGGA